MKKIFLTSIIVSFFLLIGCDLKTEDTTTTTTATTVQTYTVQFDSSGAQEVNSVNVIEGNKISEPFISKNGYVLDGWYITDSNPLNVDEKWDFDNNRVYQNLTLYAKWQIGSYTINFVTNSEDSITPIFGLFNSTLPNLPIPLNEGKTFVGWYIDIDYTEVFSSSTMPGYDITLYAKWENTISFETFGGTFVDPITQVAGTPVTNPNSPTRIGYTFLGWYVDEELTSLYSFTTMPPENILIYAGWQINNYVLSFDTNGGSYIESIIENYGADIQLPIPTKTDNHFSGWYLDSEFLTKVNFTTMPAENTILYAKWIDLSILRIQLMPSRDPQVLQSQIDSLQNLLSDELGMEVALSIATDSVSLIEAMKSEEIQVGLLSAFDYILASEEGAAEIILKSLRYDVDDNGNLLTDQPLVSGFKSQLVVGVNSGITSVADLVGKTIAISSFASTSSFVWPANLLADNDIDVMTEVTWLNAGGHDAAILSVYNGQADAAFTYKDARTLVDDDYPDVYDKVIFITNTEFIPNDTISVIPGLDPILVQRIKDAFIAISQTEEGLAIIRSVYSHEGYAEAVDSEYDIVRIYLARKETWTF